MLLFYSISDYLVYFTTYCIEAREHDVQVLSMCLMPDHTHDSVIVQKPDELWHFKQDFNSRFARTQNAVFGRKGRLLEKPFGSAPKYGSKAIRTNLIYVGNNPVERKLCIRAEEYRWNLLAYSQSKNPFSKPLVIRKASWPMKKAVKEVKRTFDESRPMTYYQLQRLFKPLNREEKEQLTDFIISTYNVVDYKVAIDYFGSYNNMLLAMHSTTGSEHDIKETFVGKSDIYYSQMINIVLRETKVRDIHKILSWDDEKKFRLFMLLKHELPATDRQIAKFLRMPVPKLARP